MTILTPPSAFCGPLMTSFLLVPMTTNSPVSSFNQTNSVSGPISEFWRATITIPGRKSGTALEPGWRDIAAFLMSLRGGENRVRLFDARRGKMRGAGSVTGMCAVKTAALAGATTITLKALKASQAIAIAADDHIGIGENLYTAIASSVSNGSGEATIQILPPLRAGIAADDAVNLVKPTGAFRLIGGFIEGMPIAHYDRSETLQYEFFEDPEFEA